MVWTYVLRRRIRRQESDDDGGAGEKKETKTLGVIQVLRKAVGGLACQLSRKKALQRCKIQRH